ncbi:MAG: YvcK family protein [Coriobacteriales bacterium]|jgi:uncharacterized cofD-like protein|nr:YvcK family protein [Coriobacteriales bacterium]
MAAPAAKVVVIGGGTGSPASIRAALYCGYQTTSVVAMADDGGSSGLLRSHTGKLPPGDIRKCLVAMAANQDDPWVQAFRQRYQYLNNHTLGNLVLTALEDATGSLPQAIALCEQLLQARGQVLPSTLDAVDMTGTTRDGTVIVGQSSLCASPTALATASLVGSPRPHPPVLDAIAEADLIVIGPGSLFTSLIAVLLVPGIIAAIKESPARLAYVTPITDHQGETWGLSAAELVETLLAHGLGERLELVIANAAPNTNTKAAGAITAVFNAIGETEIPAASATTRYLSLTDKDVARIAELGPLLICRPLTEPSKPDRHSVTALGAVLREVVEQCLSPRR